MKASGKVGRNWNEPTLLGAK